MKESFQRIVTWAKEHPYIAGVLVIGVVVLAYIAIKNGNGGGGGFSGQVGTAEDSTAQGGDFAAQGFGTGGGVETSTIAAPAQSNIDPIVYDVPGGGGFDTIGAIDGGSYADMGFLDYSPVDFTPLSFPTTAPVSSSMFDTFAPAAAAPKSSLGTQSALASSSVKASGGLTPAGSQKKSEPKNPSPAYKAGKGQRFTGYYNGVTYINGYPVFSSNTFGSVSVSAPGGDTSNPLRIQTIAAPVSQGLAGQTVVTTTQGGHTGTVKTSSGRSAAVKGSSLKK